MENQKKSMIVNKNQKPKNRDSQDRIDSILNEARKLVYGDRQTDYGHPVNDFERSAMIINAIFRDRIKPGKAFAATDIPMLQIAIKLSRESNKHKRDNLVDIAGYAETKHRVHLLEKERKQEERGRVEDATEIIIREL